jgi:hypothetical protein
MTAIRLSPSGPDIGNAGGGPLEPGPGMRLRLTEATITMAGTLIIPQEADAATAFVSTTGFGTLPAAALILTLDAPNPGLNYRAQLTLDVENSSTNAAGGITLAIDVSVDGGTVWAEVAAAEHNAGVTFDDNFPDMAPMSVWLPISLGSDLGVLGAPTPSPSIKVRARVFNDNSAADCDVGAGSRSIHFELEECF